MQSATITRTILKNQNKKMNAYWKGRRYSNPNGKTITNWIYASWMIWWIGKKDAKMRKAPLWMRYKGGRIAPSPDAQTRGNYMARYVHTTKRHSETYGLLINTYIDKYAREYMGRLNQKTGKRRGQTYINGISDTSGRKRARGSVYSRLILRSQMRN